MVAVAKALADSARETKVLEIRGGLMQGRTISAADVEELAKLPPFDVLRGQVLGAIIAPLQNLLGLVNAPLQNLVGLIDARIEQLGGEARRGAVRAGRPDGGAGGRGSRGVSRETETSPTRPRQSRLGGGGELPRRGAEAGAEPTAAGLRGRGSGSARSRRLRPRLR